MLMLVFSEFWHTLSRLIISELFWLLLFCSSNIKRDLKDHHCSPVNVNRLYVAPFFVVIRLLLGTRRSWCHPTNFFFFLIHLYLLRSEDISKSHMHCLSQPTFSLPGGSLNPALHVRCLGGNELLFIAYYRALNGLLLGSSAGPSSLYCPITCFIFIGVRTASERAHWCLRKLISLFPSTLQWAGWANSFHLALGRYCRLTKCTILV